MFFSPELLARRDDGFGLLWLAATLGSKSVFKKLPRKSVLTADIGQLCDLIVEPAEPLALRLSSNLMVGVARVYKVKQEILYTDVTNCVAALKKVVLEMQSAEQGENQLQMAQPTIRAAAVTLAVDPGAQYDLDVFVADWDALLNIKEKRITVDEDDEDMYDPEEGRAKKPPKGKAKESNAPVEDVRAAESCTLRENHEHLLSNSFDLSFTGAAPGGPDPSSSQPEGGFLDDLFLDGMDLGDGLGDDLARELGEGWGIPNPAPAPELAFNDEPMQVDNDFNFGDMQMPFNDPGTPPGLRKRKSPDQENNQDALLSPMKMALSTPTPPTFTQELLSQDQMEATQPETQANNENRHAATAAATKKKPAKKTRLLLDARTELTDEELKSARAQYLRGQKLLRDETNLKRNEKDSGRLIEDIIWGVPSYIQAPTLVDFWQENFKVQVEARTGALHIHLADDQPPPKRRKIRDGKDAQEADVADPFADFQGDYNMDAGMDMGMGMQDDPFMDAPANYDAGRQRSSEEPGQGRQVSRQSSLTRGLFGLDIEDPGSQSQSQKSSLFPWDNAGFLSSSSGAALPDGGSDRVSIDRADVRMRGSSVSRTREDSLVPSLTQEGGVPMSPGFDRGSQVGLGDDYRFEVAEDRSQLDSQNPDLNLITLERNSFNFLEYAKMQMQTLSDDTDGLSFDAIVPKLTSTRHVAAAAFYHCLVLATKDLLRLRQTEAYGPVTLLLAQ